MARLMQAIVCRLAEAAEAVVAGQLWSCSNATGEAALEQHWKPQGSPRLSSFCPLTVMPHLLPDLLDRFTFDYSISRNFISADLSRSFPLFLYKLVVAQWQQRVEKLE